MRKALLALGLAAFVSIPAWGALPVGSKAPDFTTQGAVAGKPFTLHLREQLRHGPVVKCIAPSRCSRLTRAIRSVE